MEILNTGWYVFMKKNQLNYCMYRILYNNSQIWLHFSQYSCWICCKNCVTTGHFQPFIINSFISECYYFRKTVIDNWQWSYISIWSQNHRNQNVFAQLTGQLFSLRNYCCFITLIIPPHNLNPHSHLHILGRYKWQPFHSQNFDTTLKCRQIVYQALHRNTQKSQMEKTLQILN